MNGERDGMYTREATAGLGRPGPWISRRRGLLLSGLLVVVAVMFGAVGSAYASGGTGGANSGYYVVNGCAEGDGGPDGWILFNDDSTTLTSFANGCDDPTSTNQYDGLASNTNNAPGNTTPNGDKAGWGFYAPTGTTLGNVELWWQGSTEVSAGWGAFISDNAGHLWDPCVDTSSTSNNGTICAGQSESNNQTFSLGGQGQTFVQIYTGCAGNPCPSTNTTENFATLDGSSIEIDDANGPSVGTTGGVPSGSWVAGSSTITLSAATADPVGIMAQTLYVNQTAFTSSNNSCNFNQISPCPTSMTSSFQLTASTLGGDGCYNVYIQGENTAGRFNSGPAEIVCVSSTDPAAPAITSSTGGEDTADITWTDSTNDPAPIANTFYSIAGGATQEVSGDPKQLSGSFPAGTYKVCIWLQDSAGNDNSADAACPIVTVTGPPAATPAPSGTTTTPGTTAPVSTSTGTGAPSTTAPATGTTTAGGIRPYIHKLTYGDLATTKPFLQLLVHKGSKGAKLTSMLVTLPKGLTFVKTVVKHTKSSDKVRLVKRKASLYVTLRSVKTETLRVKIGGIAESRALRAKVLKARKAHRTFTESGTVRARTSAHKLYVLHFKIKF